MAPADDDVEGFIDRVDEVSRLINGLAAGTIPPEYVDGKLERQKAEREAAAAGPQRARDARRGLPAPGAGGGAGADAGGGRDAGGTAEEEEARQAELMRKVEELKANRARKLKARARYEQYVQQQQQQQQQPPGADAQANTGGARGGVATDYTRWDMWCPSDEEDDMFGSLAPSNPGFRAMERDINERHKRMVEQRQIAERQRTAGNAAMAAGQWSEALRCYENGLDAQRHSAALHANAALAALKMGCYVQALEHCDRVLYLQEHLHARPRDPLCAKALQRRAAALQALGQHGRAAADLARALQVLGGADREVEAALRRALAMEEEGAKQRRAAKALDKAKAAGGGGGGGGAGALGGGGQLDITRLRQVEELAGRLVTAAAQRPPQQAAPRPGGGGPGAAGQQQEGGEERQQSERPGEGRDVAAEEGASLDQVCQTLTAVISADDTCNIYFRTCGGLRAASQLLAARTAASMPALPQKAAAAAGPKAPTSGGTGAAAAGGQRLWRAQEALLRLVGAACRSEVAVEEAGADEKLMGAAAKLLASPDAAMRAAAVDLLLAASAAAAPGGGTARRPGGAAAALAAKQGAGLARLLALLPGGGAALQAAALALAGNCLLDRGAAAAAATLVAAPGAAPLLGGVVRLIAAAGADSSNAPGQGGTSSGDGDSALVAEKALAFVGNMCGHPPLRAAAAGDAALVEAVAAAALGPAGAAAAGGAAATRAADAQLCAAALGALLNLSVEPGPRAALARGPAARLERLLNLACGDGGGGGKAGAAALARARAAGLLARVAKEADGAAALERLGALRRVADAISQQQAEVAAGAGDDTAAADEGSACWLDGAVRAAALLTARPGSCGGAGAGGGCGAEVGQAAIAALCAVCGGGRAPEAAVGNAALALGHFAAELEAWGPALAKADAVASLLRAARAGGRGGAAARNAGVALGKACRGGGALLERLRELRGLEVIYEYVRP
ncbi:MAG: hypothetical protein J3K34DRAFT_526875 [Monoraphidium minutum]|nr:MAG: hypothetical protein J3K34DRAFT_526875 [Monoraphidium minutum]